ncbi:MAG: hypothetical protein HDR72_04390 [Ruminococcaceae bacterium]|nr:hypothetical protein [Oscillospiraceae bacterium]
MANTDNSSGSMFNSKTITIHMIFITTVCVAFGVINIFTNAVVVGICTLAMGGIVPAVTITIRKKTAISAQGFFLSVVQLLAIIIISAAKHEMHTMFALMLASMAVASIYCNIRCLTVHWVIMDAASLFGLVFKSFFYGEESIITIIKGLLSINIGAIVLVYLIKACVKFMNDIQSAHRESEGLVQEVNTKMEDVNRLVEKQKNVVSSVSGIVVNLRESVLGLQDVSVSMSSVAEEQERTIAEIADEITNLGAETNKSLDAASKARAAADDSTRMLTENKSEVDKMLGAMSEISDSSLQIETIIKTIEDIAFQTNILALNASIEAARAGTMGKGFAVVADEVRNLAAKSDEAAKSTSALIRSSIQSVESGSKIAQTVAEKINETIKVSEQSTEFSVMIEKLTANQTAAMNSMLSKMGQMSESIAKGLDISVKNTEISQSIADEVENLTSATDNA